MKNAVARSYVLLILLGAVVGVATLYVRNVYLGFTQPSEFGTELLGGSLLAVALPDVLVATLVMLAVFSLRGAINRTFNGVVGGLLYAIAFCAAQFAFIWYAGDRFGLDLSGFAYAVPVRIFCGVFLGAGIGQWGLARVQRKSSEATSFVIVGAIVTFLLLATCNVLMCMADDNTLTIPVVAFLVVLAIVVVLSIRAIVRHKRFDWAIQQQ